MNKLKKVIMSETVDTKITNVTSVTVVFNARVRHLQYYCRTMSGSVISSNILQKILMVTIIHKACFYITSVYFLI